MEKYKLSMVALILGLALIISVSIASNGLTKFKKTTTDGITVTGSSTKKIVSDIIVWRGDFSRKANTTKDAYDLLKLDEEIIRSYLLENGVKKEEIVFSAVNITKNYSYVYNADNSIKNEIEDGFTLTQSLTLESKEVEKIESISRDITKLIDSGVEFLSSSPEYYYTKLEELKLKMIEEATKNARDRATLIAKNSKSKLSDLISANLGVFQITALNSSEEEFSYGGTYNTWSKNKNASVTVKLYYKVK